MLIHTHYISIVIGRQHYSFLQYEFIIQIIQQSFLTNDAEMNIRNELITDFLPFNCRIISFVDRSVWLIKIRKNSSLVFGVLI